LTIETLCHAFNSFQDLGDRLIPLCFICGVAGGWTIYPIIDTGQDACYDTLYEMACADSGDAFFVPRRSIRCIPAGSEYQVNGDGTVTDLSTGLMWCRHVDQDDMGGRDGRCHHLCRRWLYRLAGTDDKRTVLADPVHRIFWRTGLGSVPFIDTDYFDFEYNDTTGGARWFDCQDWSATPYVGLTMEGDTTIFGVNFADGRIKGYPKYLLNLPHA